MLIRAGYEIAIQCDTETPLMALVSVHPSRAADLRTPAVINSSGPAPLLSDLDEFGNLRTRTVARPEYFVFRPTSSCKIRGFQMPRTSTRRRCRSRNFQPRQ